MSALVEALRLVVELRDKAHRPPGLVYSGVEGFVLDEGEAFSPGAVAVPKEFRATVEAIEPEPKQCFRNALHLATSEPALAYVEGFAGLASLPGLPIAHAWCVTATGAVVDPTWETPGAEYLGVRFDLARALRLTRERGRYGVLDDWENGWPLLRERFAR